MKQYYGRWEITSRLAGSPAASAQRSLGALFGPVDFGHTFSGSGIDLPGQLRNYLTVASHDDSKGAHRRPS